MVRTLTMVVAVAATLVLGAALTIGCGGSTPASAPTAPATTTIPPDPSTIPNIAGTWTGTIQSSEFAAREISAQFAQVALTCVDGAWKTTSSSEWTGAVSGIAQPGIFDGFISVEGVANNTGVCPGVYRTSGSATATGIKWTFDSDASCAGGVKQTVTFVLRR